METVELLAHSSLFLKIATPEDIEFEREQLEAMHECRLEVYRKTHETRSGAPVTCVEWRIL
jgi:hypothetical protein